jgi:chromosome segregation ATPase
MPNGQRPTGNILHDNAGIIAIVALIIAFLGLFFPGGIERKVENSPAVKELRTSVDQKLAEVEQKITALQQAETDQINQLNKKLEGLNKLATLDQQIGKLKEENQAFQTRVNDNLLYHTQQITALGAAQRNTEAKLIQAVDQVKATINKRIDQELTSGSAQSKSSNVSGSQDRIDANFAYLTRQLNEVSHLQKDLQAQIKDHMGRVNQRLAALEQQTGKLSQDLAFQQTRVEDNLRYHTQQINSLGTAQKEAEARLVKGLDQAKALVQKLEQTLVPLSTQVKSLAEAQARIENNILYHTQQISGLHETQRKLMDEVKMTVQQIAQKIDTQLKTFKDDMASHLARANENLVFHTQKLTSLEDSQKNQSALVNKNLADIKQLKTEMETQLASINKNLKETGENIIFHSQKITGLENSQKNQLAMFNKSITDIKQQIGDLRKETERRLAETSQSLKEATDVSIAEINKNLKQVDTRLSDVSKSLKEAMDTSLAEVNKGLEGLRETINTQLKDAIEKLNLLHQQLTDLKEGTDNRFAKIEGNVNATHEQIANVRSDMDERAIEVDRNFQRINQEVNSLKELTTHIRTQLGSVEEDLDVMSQRIRNVAREAEEGAKSRLTELEKDLDTMNRKIADLTGFQDTVKTRIAEIGKDLSALTQRIDLTNYSATKNELNALLAKAAENLNAFDRQMGRMEEFNELAKSYFDRVNNNLASLSQQVAGFAEFKENTKSHLSKLDDSLSQLNQQIAGFIEFRETARSKLADVEGRLSSLILSERALMERSPVTAPTPSR